jgi:type II restriction/modification system DNA methylase subunit YeeA
LSATKSETLADLGHLTSRCGIGTVTVWAKKHGLKVFYVDNCWARVPVSRLVRATQARPEQATAQLAELFSKMRTGGYFGADVIKWFNGGLFDDAAVLSLETVDLKLIADTAAEHDWSEIDPAIFGNLFEEALKATRERPALGAHYTDRDKILKIVEPVIVQPLTAEWEAAYAEIKASCDEIKVADDARKAVLERAAEALRAGAAEAMAGEAARRKELVAITKKRDAAIRATRNRLEAFLTRLADFRVLDPACGSGNFLYVALHALKDLELRAQVDAERLGIPAPVHRVGLDCVRGIEIEEYAAELARVTLWIGDLQWMRKNGYTAYAEPTFPFPEGLTPNIPAADYAADTRAIPIAEAAAELNGLREAWLNPPDLVRIEPEVVPGYPDRALPKDEEAARVLKTRTLTSLYNQRPGWLDMAHKRLDAAVAAAYGWPVDLSDEVVLERLFTLNQKRAAAES